MLPVFFLFLYFFFSSLSSEVADRPTRPTRSLTRGSQRTNPRNSTQRRPGLAAGLSLLSLLSRACTSLPLSPRKSEHNKSPRNREGRTTERNRAPLAYLDLPRQQLFPRHVCTRSRPRRFAPFKRPSQIFPLEASHPSLSLLSFSTRRPMAKEKERSSNRRRVESAFYPQTRCRPRLKLTVQIARCALRFQSDTRIRIRILKSSPLSRVEKSTLAPHFDESIAVASAMRIRTDLSLSFDPARERSRWIKTRVTWATPHALVAVPPFVGRLSEVFHSASHTHDATWDDLDNCPPVRRLIYSLRAELVRQ